MRPQIDIDTALGMAEILPDKDVYEDDDEDRTLPAPVRTEVGFALYRRLAELETTNTEYDVDEVIAEVKARFA